MTIRVTHLTTVHAPFDTRIFAKECRSLVEAGYDVSLIAPHDRAEVVDGVRVRPIPRPVTRASRMLIASSQALAAAVSERADVYHCHDPELIPIGLLLKALGKCVIYDVHEDVPSQTLGKHWIPRLLRRPLAAVIAVVETIAARCFDGIVAATPTIAARFPDWKTITVHNYPRIDSLPTDPVSLGERDRCVAYVGAISEDRGLFNMLSALVHVDGRLLLAGRFSPPSLADRARQAPAWRQVDYHGLLDRQGVANLLSQSRVGIVTLLPTANYLPSLPVKLFEYMLAGLPVVASDFPLWRAIVDDAACGLLVDPLDPDAIAQACQWLLDHPAEAQAMGRSGRAAVIAKYNWSSEAERLVSFYRRLLDGLPSKNRLGANRASTKAA
jgi:glycosyltransferase involved in cell wall biosynthesis